MVTASAEQVAIGSQSLSQGASEQASSVQELADSRLSGKIADFVCNNCKAFSRRSRSCRLNRGVKRKDIRVAIGSQSLSQGASEQASSVQELADTIVSISDSAIDFASLTVTISDVTTTTIITINVSRILVSSEDLNSCWLDAGFAYVIDRHGSVIGHENSIYVEEGSNMKPFPRGGRKRRLLSPTAR